MNIRIKLRRAGLLVAAGLLLDLFSLLPIHPLAFIAFVGLGMPITAAGMIYFLLSLLAGSENLEGKLESRPPRVSKENAICKI